MATNTAKVLASRNIIFYYAAYASSTTFPDVVTYPWGTAWPSPWIDGGYTQGGLGFSAEISRTDIRMDQSLDPVLRPATGRTVTMSANLGQYDLATLVAATGQGTVATLNPTTASAGYDMWSMGNTVADNFYSAAFDILHPGDSMPVRIIGPYVQPTGAESWNFGPESAAVTPFNVTLFPRPTDNAVAFIRDYIVHS